LFQSFLKAVEPLKGMAYRSGAGGGIQTLSAGGGQAEIKKRESFKTLEILFQALSFTAMHRYKESLKRLK
ncbi:hypothetical protein, partial [Pseudomonas savastanoi]|uniref:hypothetical protein n=1 Tax=Pseudomonas savastanoi TaxID=29438 RepID=UPI000BC5E499